MSGRAVPGRGVVRFSAVGLVCSDACAAQRRSPLATADSMGEAIRRRISA